MISDATRPPAAALPLLGFAEAGSNGYFDDGGFPSGKEWDEIAFPGVEDERAYALEITGECMMPAYRDGTIIIVSPSAPVRRGDRVVVKTRAGEVLANELKRKTGKTVELRSISTQYPDRSFPTEDVLWIARIIWASQ